MTFDQGVALATAIGTVVAALVAVALGAVAESRTRRDRREAAASAAQRLLAERQDQAFRVAIWSDPLDYWVTDENYDFGVWVRNSSDLPIFDVEIPFLHVDESIVSEPMGLRRRFFPALSPHETQRITFTPADWNNATDFSVYFLDARGVRWRRDLDGTLTEGATVNGDWRGRPDQVRPRIPSKGPPPPSEW